MTMKPGYKMMSLTDDQYKFLVANLTGLSLALPYKYIPRNFRNEFNYFPGLIMLYYCFGTQANSMVIFAAISYAICKLTPQQHVQRATMCASLAFLSYAHLTRQILDYGSYVLDISGPSMIAVQKMTSLGFCLYDGWIKKQLENNISNNNGSPNEKDDNNNDISNDCYTKNANGIDNVKSIESIGLTTGIIGSARNDIQSDRLTEEQKRLVVMSAPSFNEFMGYFFHFPSVLCGPIMYYSDYSEFVSAPDDRKLPPGRLPAALKKLGISVICAILHLCLNHQFDIRFLRSPEFLIETPFLVRFYYVIVLTTLSRLKYYVAWHLGEAISNVSGLGYNATERKWNLISNMNLLKFETSLNLRDAIHAWNKTTQSWLRRTAYERAPKKLSVVATYMLSAIWHGFYPGYYMTFLGGAIFTYAARDGRRLIRPLFQRGKILPKIYDCITFILTRFTIAYAAFPFVILDFRNNFEIYKSLYFSFHILALVGIVMGRVIKRK